MEKKTREIKIEMERQKQTKGKLESNNYLSKKIVKRYQNRKLYDTEKSRYVTLGDIERMVKLDEDFVVIDNNTKEDITVPIFVQIVFEAEKKSGEHPPLFMLKEMIKYGNGGISGFLQKLGAFSKEDIYKQASSDKKKSFSSTNEKNFPSFSKEIKGQGLDLTHPVQGENLRESKPIQVQKKSGEIIPHLPISPHSFTDLILRENT